MMKKETKIKKMADLALEAIGGIEKELYAEAPDVHDHNFSVQLAAVRGSLGDALERYREAKSGHSHFEDGTERPIKDGQLKPETFMGHWVNGEYSTDY